MCWGLVAVNLGHHVDLLQKRWGCQPTRELGLGLLCKESSWPRFNV